MAEAKAAIPPDERLLDRSLGDLSALEFLQILNRPDLNPGAIRLLPDKKKYELWVEESVVVKITVREILEKLGREKKKLELEKFRYEDVIDPLGPIVNPAVIENLAQQVADKLKTMR